MFDAGLSRVLMNQPSPAGTAKGHIFFFGGISISGTVAAPARLLRHELTMVFSSKNALFVPTAPLAFTGLPKPATHMCIPL